MWDKEYRFTLIGNESEEMHGDWDTANFKIPFSFEEIVIRNVDSIEGAIGMFKKIFENYSNGDYDWDSNEDGTFGQIRFGNDEDGLGVVFEIVQIT